MGGDKADAGVVPVSVGWSPLGLSVLQAPLPAAEVRVPPWTYTGVPMSSSPISRLAPELSTRLVPWLAGVAGSTIKT